MNNRFGTISNDAVMTVLKCLGMRGYEYEKCRMMYRSIRWLGMRWCMDQYNGLLTQEVRPYFKEKFKK